MRQLRYTVLSSIVKVRETSAVNLAEERHDYKCTFIERILMDR